MKKRTNIILITIGIILLMCNITLSSCSVSHFVGDDDGSYDMYDEYYYDEDDYSLDDEWY